MKHSPAGSNLNFIHMAGCLSDVQRRLLHAMANDIPRTTDIIASNLNLGEGVICIAMATLANLDLVAPDRIQPKRWAITPDGRNADAILHRQAACP